MVEIISMVLNDMQRTQANLSMMPNPPGKSFFMTRRSLNRRRLLFRYELAMSM